MNDVSSVVNAVHDTVPVPPVPVFEVERRVRGARRRRTATRVGAVVVAGAVAASVVVGALAVTGGGDEKAPVVKEPAPPRLLTYTGDQAQISLSTLQTALPGAPDSFRAFAEKTLTATWQGYYKGKPACQDTPQLGVDALRTDGYAFGTIDDVGQPGCAAGGGSRAIWAVVDGSWKEIYSGQDEVTCTVLKKYSVPSEIGVTECIEGQDSVPWTG
jgi:hypothetical protein